MWEGTLLLVTHDRRLLESVRIAEWMELKDGRRKAAPAGTTT
jgi:ATPase subunit of ABC transporter with duplicated ATPase domains